MKKFFIGLLNVFLGAFIFLLLFSFYGRTVFTGFITNFLGELNTTVTDTEFIDRNNIDDSSVSVEDDLSIENFFSSPEYKEILENKEVQDLIQKYVDTTIMGVTDTDSLNEVDLTGDIIDFIKENKDVLENEYNVTITDEDIDNLKDSEELGTLTETYIESVKSVSNELTDNQKKLIKAYNFVCSTLFKIILIALIILNVVLIAILQKSLYKWILSLGINVLSSGVLTIVLGVIMHFSINAIVYKMGLGLKFDFLNIALVGTIASIIGIVFIIVYLIIKKIVNKNKTKELYDEVSQGVN